MKRIVITVALILNLGVATVYAQRRPVKMRFSGTNVATTINLLTNTVTDETQLAGKGTFGAFTFRELHADGASARPPVGCTGPNFAVLAGAGVFTFEDRSLLIVTVREGSGCVNLAALNAALTVKYDITGGTGRFKDASGELTMTSILKVILRNASNAPALLTNAGEFEGTVFGVTDEDGQDERQ